ncbi:MULTISPECIES: hypothetical protein [unclassified Pseudomonas]|nr:hypothetical protein [Pseudomonas sp. 10C3]MEE3505013.1 hypothetical protein [Pseudomonas sp. 10C3]
MNVDPRAAEHMSVQTTAPVFFTETEPHFGGDQSPLNDSDADDDSDPEGDLDLEELGLEEFIDAEKLDSTISGDVGSSTLS